jgi:hypothetical protein
MIDKEKLAAIVGASSVSNERSKLDEYSSDMSFVTKMRPSYVVKRP